MILLRFELLPIMAFLGFDDHCVFDLVCSDSLNDVNVLVIITTGYCFRAYVFTIGLQGDLTRII